MTRYRTAFKGLRIVKLDHRNKWTKNRGIQDALKTIRNGKLCDFLNTYASSVLKSADLVLLAYNSRGEVRGVAGVDEADELHVTIICNEMGKKNRGLGFAPGKGLLDLLKKIAVKKKKDITLSSINTAVNYYKRFGFKQNPKSSSKTNLIWEWRPSYSRARRFEYESVNSNSNNSNSNNRSSATTVKISPRTQLKKNTLKRSINTLKRVRIESRKSKVKEMIREKRKALRVLKNRYNNRSVSSNSNSNRSSATVVKHGGKRRKQALLKES